MAHPLVSWPSEGESRSSRVVARRHEAACVATAVEPLPDRALALAQPLLCMPDDPNSRISLNVRLSIIYAYKQRTKGRSMAADVTNFSVRSCERESLCLISHKADRGSAPSICHDSSRSRTFDGLSRRSRAIDACCYATWKY